MNKKITMKKLNILIYILLIGISSSLYAQDLDKTFTLEDVIKISQEQSPDAIRAKHRYRASYWQMRTYKAEFLPKVALNGTLPQYSREIVSQWEDGQQQFFDINQLNTSANLSVTQNLGLTGGTFFINSSLNRLDNFYLDTSFYNSVPLSIGYRQNINGFNELKWKKKIEPLAYEEAKSTYARSMENVALKAVNYFFQLALAQRNLQIAKMNYSNTDTLYKISQGRYQIGTIAENELLQMELSSLNAGLALNEAGIDLEMKRFQLRSFLGYNETVNIDLIVPTEVLDFDINVQRAIEEAYANSPDIKSFEKDLLEAERDVAQANAERGINLDLYASFGLTQKAGGFADSYANPLDQQSVRLGVVVPILDWGLSKGKYKMAKSNQEVIKTNIEQSKVDFEQEILLQVMQFNLQDDQVHIAAKADTIAQNRYEVTKQRFLIGKIDVLDLNDSQTSKDKANTQYISALLNYWSFYYNLRILTLYDFYGDKKIQYDFTTLIE